MAFNLRNFPGIREAKIVVMWDMIECPIPQDLNLVEVSNNIRKALKEEGYHGVPEINAFTDIYQPLEMFFDACVAPLHLPYGDDREARRREIVVALMCEAVLTYSPANFLLILGDMISKHSSLLRSLTLLNMKNYNCMVAHPEFSTVQYDKSVSSKWLWKALANGEESLEISLLEQRKRTQNLSNQVSAKGKEKTNFVCLQPATTPTQQDKRDKSSVRTSHQSKSTSIDITQRNRFQAFDLLEEE